MRSVRAWLVVLLVMGLLGACDGASSDRGLELMIRVPSGQLVREAFPRERGGPKLTFVDVRDPRVGAGDLANPVVGRAEGSAFALNVGAKGEGAYWVVPVSLPDDVNPGELQFQLSLGIGRRVTPGPLVVLMQAVDGHGTPGPVRETMLEIESTEPTGTLVFTLEWDAELDADLLVVDPRGVTIGPKNVNSAVPPRPGSPPSAQDGSRAGGILDQDSNANCVPEGRRRENVYWTAPPPAGRYRAFVQLASTCGLERTAFRFTVRRNGVSVSSLARSGTLYASDGRSQPLEPPESPGLLLIDADLP